MPYAIARKRQATTKFTLERRPLAAINPKIRTAIPSIKPSGRASAAADQASPASNARFAPRPASNVKKSASNIKHIYCVVSRPATAQKAKLPVAAINRAAKAPAAAPKTRRAKKNAAATAPKPHAIPASLAYSTTSPGDGKKKKAASSNTHKKLV